MKLAMSYSLFKEGNGMQFPQLELPLCNTLEGLYTKVDTAGARCCKLQLGCHLLGTGDGLTPQQLEAKVDHPT